VTRRLWRVATSPTNQFAACSGDEAFLMASSTSFQAQAARFRQPSIKKALRGSSGSLAKFTANRRAFAQFRTSRCVAPLGDQIG
jgi:hypothetical protein